VSGPQSFKDHFSPLASVYSESRPTYPAALLDFVAGLCTGHGAVWDCACGSGQAAIDLAARFDKVFATDASAKQIAGARPHHVSLTVSAKPRAAAWATHRSIS